MTVRELIDLLKTFPPDAVVVVPHYWDADENQLDGFSAEGLSIEDAIKPDTAGDYYLKSPNGPIKVVTFRG